MSFKKKKTNLILRLVAFCLLLLILIIGKLYFSHQNKSNSSVQKTSNKEDQWTSLSYDSYSANVQVNNDRTLTIKESHVLTSLEGFKFFSRRFNSKQKNFYGKQLNLKLSVISTKINNKKVPWKKVMEVGGLDGYLIDYPAENIWTGNSIIEFEYIVKGAFISDNIFSIELLASASSIMPNNFTVKVTPPHNKKIATIKSKLEYDDITSTEELLTSKNKSSGVIQSESPIPSRAKGFILVEMS